MADKKTARLSEFKRGVKNGLPIVIGYISAGIALGLMCQRAGISVAEGLFMSFIVLAGAGEFTAVSMLLLGCSIPEIVLTNAILNFRYFLQCSTLSRRLEPGVPWPLRAFIGHSTADESFSIATIGEPGEINAAYMLGLNIPSFAAWVGGTGIGCYGASWIPSDLQASMGISLFGMFIGLLVPTAKKSKPVLFVICLSAAINITMRVLPLTKGWNMGWSILISTVIAATAGAVLFPRPEEE